MSQPLHVSQIISRVESMIKQLEDLSYSKNAKMMLNLNGHIDEAITCGALNKSVYMQRIDKANLLIMADQPDPVKVGLGALEGVQLDPHISNVADGQPIANFKEKQAQEARAKQDPSADAASNAPQIEPGPVPNA